MENNENKNNLTEEEKKEKVEKSISLAKKLLNFVKNHKKLFEKFTYFAIVIVIYCLLCNPTIESLLTGVLGETMFSAVQILPIVGLLGGE